MISNKREWDLDNLCDLGPASSLNFGTLLLNWQIGSNNSNYLTGLRGFYEVI